jgi:hypothetical protein
MKPKLIQGASAFKESDWLGNARKSYLGWPSENVRSQCQDEVGSNPKLRAVKQDIALLVGDSVTMNVVGGSMPSPVTELIFQSSINPAKK